MQALAGFAIATFIIASVAVAFRLLAIHRRSGEAPELLLGLMLLLSVGLGYPLTIASGYVATGTGRLLAALSALAIAAGFSCLFAFTWRVFQRDSAWGRATAGSGIALLGATTVWIWFDLLAGGDLPLGGDASAQTLLESGTVMVAYVWTGWESLRYHAMVKRRLQLGMADPVVCNRLMLWGLMGSIATVGVLVNIVPGLFGVSVVTDPLVLLASSVTGMCQTVLLVLAFSPPRGYLDWVRGAAASA